MNRDEIRKLLGGYATGTLTVAEQKLLFEAALDDQELFDELSREQALKEMLDLPGARPRLIAALEPATPVEKTWWRKPWPWAAAATLAMGIVIAVALWPKPKPTTVDISAVRPQATATPVSAPLADQTVDNRKAPAPKPAPQAERRKEAKASAGTGAAPMPSDRRDQPKAGDAKNAAGEPLKTEAAEKKAPEKDVVREVAAAAPPPPAASAPVRAVPLPPTSSTSNGQIVADPGPVQTQFRPTEQSPSVQQAQLAAQTQAAQTGQRSLRASEPADKLERSKTSGFAGLGGAKAKAAPRFACEYRFDGNGHLDLTPLSDGFLIVTLLDVTGARDPLSSQGRVLASQSVRINLTEFTTSVDILFSSLNIARDLDAPSKQQQRVETKESGLIEDPTPSSNSRLSVTLQVPKRN